MPRRSAEGQRHLLQSAGAAASVEGTALPWQLHPRDPAAAAAAGW